MRDRTRRRNYSPAAEEFRRIHERHREWGVTQRHAQKLRRLHGHSDSAPVPAAVSSQPAVTEPPPQCEAPHARQPVAAGPVAVGPVAVGPVAVGPVAAGRVVAGPDRACEPEPPSPPSHPPSACHVTGAWETIPVGDPCALQSVSEPPLLFRCGGRPRRGNAPPLQNHQVSRSVPRTRAKVADRRHTQLGKTTSSRRRVSIKAGRSCRNSHGPPTRAHPSRRRNGSTANWRSFVAQSPKMPRK